LIYSETSCAIFERGNNSIFDGVVPLLKLYLVVRRCPNMSIVCVAKVKDKMANKLVEKARNKVKLYNFFYTGNQNRPQDGNLLDLVF
jgi:hypothetical protein